MINKISLKNKDFPCFLRWYKEIYANMHIEDFDTANAIVEVVEAPQKYQREYNEYQLVKYQGSEDK